LQVYIIFLKEGNVMSLSNGSENMVMPVAPMYNGGYGGGFGSSFGGDGWWIILLLLFAGGGWGNGFGGGYGNMMLGYDFPWLLNGQSGINTNTNNGFQNAMLNDNITSVRDGIASLSTQLCNCCGDMQMSLANGFAGVEQGANARQMANMNQNFALQTAMLQGFNGVQSQQAECCCENRLGIANLGSDIAREACATRTTDTQNTQAILNTINTGVQSIKDQLCQDKIDAKNDEISNLRQQIAMKDLAASQIAQNAFIQQGFSDEVDQLYNRLNNCPVPSTPVFGRTPIFTCNNNGCGCGCNGGF
jgi:hypothetical protein